MAPSLPSRDQKLVQIVDAALTDSARRSGDWLVCKLGCTQCCVGVFAINSLDALRLQHGLSELERDDPERAARIRVRALASIARIRNDFPGNPATGILDETEEAAARFEDFANDDPCPALDPGTGGCDLYAARPMTCRIFGPPVRSEDGLGVCELCYDGASEEVIAACEMQTTEANRLETDLIAEIESATPQTRTIVAFVLAK